MSGGEREWRCTVEAELLLTTDVMTVEQCAFARDLWGCCVLLPISPLSHLHPASSSRPHHLTASGRVHPLTKNASQRTAWLLILGRST